MGSFFAGLGLVKTVVSWLSGIDVKSVANAVAQGYEAKAKSAADSTIATVQAARDRDVAQVGAARDVDVARAQADREIAADMIRADLRRNELQSAASVLDRADRKMSWARPVITALCVYYFGAWVLFATGTIAHRPDPLPDALSWLVVGILGSIFALRTIFEKPAQSQAKGAVLESAIIAQQHQPPSPPTGGRK